jgi:hypothetical protein
MARKTATFSNPASAGAYQSGDIIANSASAGSVVPITFNLDQYSGNIHGASCVVTPASGNLVITALDFDLLLFPAGVSLPFADAGYPADNAALNISAAAMRELVAVFPFYNGSWRNPAGVLTAGTSGYQASTLGTRSMASFNTGTAKALVGVVQAKGAWTPGAVINRFDFALDLTFE